MASPHILILHGWGSSSQSWSIVKALLEAKGIRVFVPDLPGFGGAPPPDRPWNIEDYARWVKEYADTKNLDRFFLLGHSFGGRVAVECANRYPERLRGVIFVAAAGVTPRKKWKVRVFSLATKAGDFIFSIPPLHMFKGFARRIIYFLAQERDYREARGVMRDVMKNAINRDLTPLLRHVSSPALIVWGSDDTMTPVSDAQIFHRNIPHSKLVVFEGGKHGLNLQMPEKLVETVVEWIGSFG